MTISLEQIFERAKALAGRTADFGREDYLPGLEVLVDAAASSPHACDALDNKILQYAAQVLAMRASSEAASKAAPECLAQPLAPQLVVIGLPRSGTTALHQILATDASYQWMPSWLTFRPHPRPPRADWDGDPVYRDRATAYIVEGPNPLHEVAPEDPEECILVMQQSFMTMTWVSSFAVPEYHEWFIEQDERPSYLRYADNLRLMANGDTKSTWLLKNPSHTFGFAAMLDIFPNATFLHIHRDPVSSIVSGCSLVASMAGSEGFFTASELGKHRLRIWSLAAERMEAAREANPTRKIIDIDYRAFIADPVATVKGIYAELGRTHSRDTIDAMEAWVRDRPRDRHGKHRYAAEDFGLTAEVIRDRMAGYIERYGIDRPMAEPCGL